MYEAFYGFRRKPFELSPDPDFLYATPSHREALANLCYGIEQNKGFIVLTGEVGTGKTLIARMVIDALFRSRVPYSYVVNPRMEGTELVYYLLCDLGVKVASSQRVEVLLALNRYLIDSYRRRVTPVLIVDEAHLMEWSALEEIRLLTNLETFEQKLLQIILIGQPELDARLDSDECRQVKQRITFRYQLKGMSPDEVRGYIERRFQVAGAAERRCRTFPEDTVVRIIKYSEGIPRIINSLCDRALICGYAQQSPVITVAMVDEAARDLHLQRELANVAAKVESQTRESPLIRRVLHLLHGSGSVSRSDRPNSSRFRRVGL